MQVSSRNVHGTAYFNQRASFVVKKIVDLLKKLEKKGEKSKKKIANILNAKLSFLVTLCHLTCWTDLNEFWYSDSI